MIKKITKKKLVENSLSIQEISTHPLRTVFVRMFTKFWKFQEFSIKLNKNQRILYKCY